MKPLSKNISTLLFVLLTGMLVVVAFISYNKLLLFNKSVGAVMHTNEVKNKIVEVMSCLEDGEIGQRGYLLTGDSVFLQPFIGAEQRSNRAFATLDTLVNDNPTQQDNLKRLETLVNERYFLLTSNLRLFKNHPNLPADSALLRGKVIMDKVMSQVALMLKEENRLLDKRIKVKDRTAIITPVFLLLLSLFSILIITIFFFRLQKETRDRISITESNMLLQIAKEQIEVSEKRFRTLFETIPHMVWTATPDGKKNSFNDYFINYTGLPFEELKGDGWQQTIFPEDLERELREWHHVIKTGEDFKIEKRVRHHSGSYRWHLCYGIAQKNNEGSIIGWIGTNTEIEDQVKVKEALAKGEEQFRTFANSIQNLAWIADSKGSMYWYNQRWFDYTGTTLEEMEGWGWQKVHHPDHVQKVVEFAKEAWGKGEAFELTFPLRRYNGEYHWFLTRVYPVKDAGGKTERWIGTNTDITEQVYFTEELEKKVKERTNELQIQNETFKQAEESSRQGSYSFNLTTGKLTYSDNLFRLLGCLPGEFEPSLEEFNKYVHPDDRDYVQKAAEKVLQSKTADEWNYRMNSKNGTVINIKGTGRVIESGDEKLLVGTLQDVTRDVLAAKELKEKNLALENSNAELASFSYVASHDLQEPLRKIQGFSKRILDQDKDKLSGTTSDYFNRINLAAKRMQNLIESLLSYSRTNLSEVVFEKTDLNQTLVEVQTVLNELIVQKKAVIESQTLPVLNAVPLQMNQLFLNLIGNSLKYSKTIVAPMIKISAQKVTVNEESGRVEQNGDFWKIAISDNGIGFEQQYENKIFEHFQRLHGKTEYEGTGIGLAICKKIVQTHNGTISATGNPGIGSTFTIYLPDNNNL